MLAKKSTRAISKVLSLNRALGGKQSNADRSIRSFASDDRQQALRNRKPADKVSSGQELKDALVAGGINVEAMKNGRGLEALDEEIKSNLCQITWVVDDGKRKLVRLVKLVRTKLILKKPSQQHDLILLEVNRATTPIEDLDLPDHLRRVRLESVSKPLTFKMTLDDSDVFATCQQVMLSRLGLSLEWQDRNVRLYNEIETISYVKEEKSSKNYPGLPTWYQIEELGLRIDVDLLSPNDMRVPCLPESNAFSTEYTTMKEHVFYTWEWQPYSVGNDWYKDLDQGQTQQESSQSVEKQPVY